MKRKNGLMKDEMHSLMSERSQLRNAIQSQNKQSDIEKEKVLSSKISFIMRELQK